MTVATDRTKISAYLTERMAAEARVLATLRGVSVSKLVEDILRREIEAAARDGVPFDKIIEASSPERD